MRCMACNKVMWWWQARAYDYNFTYHAKCWLRVYGPAENRERRGK